MKAFLTFSLILWGIGVYAQGMDQQVLERLMVRNRYQGVLKYIDSLEQAGKDVSDMLYYRGRAHEGLLHYKEAYRSYTDWLRQDTLNRDADLALARVASLAGRTMRAMDIYEKLAETDSLDFYVNYQLARLYQQNGKLNKALPIYSRLWEADTANAVLLKRMGDCYLKMNSAIHAVGCYRKAFGLDPADGEVVVKAVNIMMALPDLFPDFIEPAVTWIDTALVYSPRLNTLRQLRGMLQYLSRRYETSERIFNELIVEGDSARLNFKYLGLSRFHLYRFCEAVPPLAFADSLFRDDKGRYTDLDLAMRYGEALGRCYEPQKALQIFSEIERQLMPDSLLLSRLAFLSGSISESPDNRELTIGYYWKAYRLNPKNISAVTGLARNFYGIFVNEDRRRQVAEKEIRRALFCHILLLQKVRDPMPGREDSMHAVSKHILQKELDELFFRGETNLIVADPDGKKYTYSADSIRELIAK